MYMQHRGLTKRSRKFHSHAHPELARKLCFNTLPILPKIIITQYVHETQMVRSQRFVAMPEPAQTLCLITIAYLTQDNQ